MGRRNVKQATINRFFCRYGHALTDAHSKSEVAVEYPICAQSAFNYYRVPPQILMLYPPIPQPDSKFYHGNIAACECVVDLLGAPVHRLSTIDSSRAKTNLYVTHVCTRELPFGSIQETDHNFCVTSPALTLLTMAPSLSRTQLLMAMYELCGEFSVFRPFERAERFLQEAYRQGMIPLGAGWIRVKDTQGRKTNLWRRDPLVEKHELEQFARNIDGFDGAKKFRWALERMTGTCASPFEVQASMLLGLGRRVGGEGLPIKNNHRLALTKLARNLYRHECCYADIYIEGTEAHPAIDIECQGSSVHGSEAASILDSDRAAALESLGVQVLPLTYRQFVNEESYEAVRTLIGKKLNRPLKAKTSIQKNAEQKLRAELFINWETLAQPSRT